LLKGDNLPVGVIENEVYQQQTIPLESGELLFFYSDGITEARNVEGHEFGTERLMDALQQMHGHRIPPRVMIQVIRTQLTRHEGTDNLQDDRSCIALHYEGEAESLHTIRMFDLPWHLDSLVEMRHQTLICADIVGLSAEDSAALVLASIETLSNIIRHAQAPLSDASIHVQLNLAEYGIGVTFHYLGDAFQPVASEPDFSGEAEGGFGMYIITNSVDTVDYDSPYPGVCRVRLIKRRDPGVVI
jgi:anti-sigma regulatory factor (Ser/Thr protein kinase)